MGIFLVVIFFAYFGVDGSFTVNLRLHITHSSLFYTGQQNSVSERSGEQLEK